MTVYYTVALRTADTREAKDENRALILPLLLSHLTDDPHQPTTRDKNGRLFLSKSPTLDISLSHSDLYTAYAAADGRIGIDLERPDHIRDPEKLAARFFTEAEQAVLKASPTPLLTACEIWTKKEALAKYLGQGLAKTIHIDTTTPQKDVVFHIFSPTLSKIPHILTLCTPTNTTLLPLEITPETI